MSFAYDAIRWDYEAKPDAKYEGSGCNIREIRPWETSMSCGGRTGHGGEQGGLLFEFPPETTEHPPDELQADPATKESRRNSTADQDRSTRSPLAVELGATNGR